MTMINTRKVRLLALAAFIIFLLVVLVKTSSSYNTFTPSTLNESSSDKKQPSSRIAPVSNTKTKPLDADKNIKVDDNTKISNAKQIDETDESKVKEIEESKQNLKNKNANDDLTTGKGSTFDPEKELNEILSMSPVIIFSKSNCPYSKNLKSLLSNDYDITPEPLKVELDRHKSGKVFQEYIGKLTGRTTVPNLFVGGKSRGGCDEMIALHKEGKLLESLQAWGGKDIQVSKVNAPSNS